MIFVKEIERLLTPVSWEEDDEQSAFLQFVLEPLLFFIYINSVTNINLSNGSTLVLFADDMLLFKPISSEDDYTNL